MTVAHATDTADRGPTQMGEFATRAPTGRKTLVLELDTPEYAALGGTEIARRMTKRLAGAP